MNLALSVKRSRLFRLVATGGASRALPTKQKTGDAHMFACAERAAQTAWAAWHNGDFDEAFSSAEDLVRRETALDEARHILALVAHVNGQNRAALAVYDEIRPRYRRLAELDEPILLAHLRLGDATGAEHFAKRRGLLKDAATRERLRLATESPMGVTIGDTVELPFTEDALTPVMPGIKVRVNGHECIARLDTGGSFLHLTRSQAESLEINYAGAERGFGALRSTDIWQGIADLETNGMHMRHTPVHVFPDDALSGAQIVAAHGVELGPVIGTNVLEQFLSTIDVPGQRLILSPRGSETARVTHLSRLSGGVHEVRFAMRSTHFMIAKGRLNHGREINFFIDSGLVATRADGKQAAMLVSKNLLHSLGIPKPDENGLTELPGIVALGAAEQTQHIALVVPGRTWRRFGDWSGIRVDALLSHGFLKRYRWTLDFDRRVYLLHEPQG